MTKPLQVMKFGGTSVGDATCIARAAQIVASSAKGMRVVVVVSAMSGVTNRLIDSAKRAGEGDTESGAALVEALRQQHRTALAALVSDETDRTAVEHQLEAIFAEGKRLYDGTAMLRELTPRTLDVISSLGERLCAPIFAGALRQLGAKSRSIEATELIVTDSYHGGAEPRADETRRKSAELIGPLLGAGETPVVTGFIGATHDGKLTTLGRGGSDYSATILAAALDADEIIIWTDVEGVLTADPR
ncbi:MAG TPA: aspartate kinase, partial [Candidatus Angelobacter sp.]|nr:aspartate kinase [Candidatus Angelobacter sp.]